MAFEGMDVDEVEQIGHQLNGQAGDIGQVISTIEGLIGRAESAWKGQDAQKFQDEWNSAHRGALTAAQNAISNLSTVALQNVSQQRAASQ